MSKTFRDNLQVLRKRWPEIASKVLNTPPPAELKLLSTRSRWPSLALYLGQRRFLFHSLDHPVKEAQEQLAGLTIPEDKNVLLLGFGLGYHVLEVLRKLPRESQFVVVEQHPPILRLAMESVDLRPLFADRRLILFLSNTPEEIFSQLKLKVFQLVNNDLIVLRHDTSYLLFRDYYDDVESRIRDLIVWGKKNFEAGARYRRQYQRNIIRNLRFFLLHPGLDHLRAEGTVAIVAPGPSLERAFPVLKSVKGKVPIVAVDTALKPLLMRGIRPDLVVSIDPTELNYIHFEGLSPSDVEDVGLVIDPQVFFRIPASWAGEVFSPPLTDSKIHQLFSDIVEKKVFIEKGMSVSHTAFSFAKALGAEEVVFLGLDLSFRKDASHVSGSANFSSDISGRRLLTVPGRDGEVITDDVFFSYIKHFEVELASAGVRVFNASYGARIKGMEFVDPEFLLQRSGSITRPGVSPGRRIEDLVQRAKARIRYWTEKTEEIETIAGDLADERDLVRLKDAYSRLRDYGVIIDILEETMESTAILLASRRLWMDKGAEEKFRFYFQSLASTARFILEEVKNADLVGR